MQLVCDQKSPSVLQRDPRHGAALVLEAAVLTAIKSAEKIRICGLCVYECASSACNPILEKRNEELSHVCRVRTNTVK